MSQIEIRRNARLSAVLGSAAGVMAIAYLDRASTRGGVFDWLLCLVLAAIALTQLAALVNGRTPMLVADDQGVRIRLGQEWLGLPWSSLEQVVVEQRDGPIRDGRLVLVPRSIGSAVDDLLPSSQRAVRWQRRMYGEPLTVPLSISTRSSSPALVEDLRQLADGRADVVLVRGRERASLATPMAHSAPSSAATRPGSAPLEANDAVTDAATDVASVAVPIAPPRVIDPVAAIRAARQVMRAEIVSPARPRMVAPEPAPMETVTSESPSPSGAVVFDDYAPAAAPRPVIGPILAAARERAGLSLDELSERTRIRPHLLEAMEVDDFGPCGGDFYARGHLRTLARYLGLDLEELVAAYDAHYSHAPINARRVFEAELATGMSGGLRTRGGPRWSLLVGAVLVLALVWGVARFFTEQPAEIAAPTQTVRDSAGLAANEVPITSPLTRTSKLTVKAVGGRTHVVLRDRLGTVLWSGVLHRGVSRQVAGVAPFTIDAVHGAYARVSVGKSWLGPVGPDATKARRTVG